MGWLPERSLRPFARQSRLPTTILTALSLVAFILFASRSLPQQYFASRNKEKDDYQDEVFSYGVRLSQTLTSKARPPWTFDSVRDRNDRSLTAKQCQIAFSKAYSEIDRAVEFWREQGGVRPEHIDLAHKTQNSMRLMIKNQQLYIREVKGYSCFPIRRERFIGTLMLIHRALVTAREPVPDIEFSVTVSDTAPMMDAPLRTQWSYVRDAYNPTSESLWTMPAFNFWSWKSIVGSYTQLEQQLRDHDTTSFKSKIPKAVWRGALDVHPDLRGNLMDVASEKPWADVYAVDWGDQAQLKSKWLTPIDHCRYMFPIYTEGTSWSGRMQYQLACRSVSIFPKSQWLTHLHPLLIASGPSQNHIEVEDTWQDLSEKVQHYIQNPDEAEAIANRSAEVFRDTYLTPAAEACYWRRLFHSWSGVAFVPNVTATSNEAETDTHAPGITFEEFSLDMKDYPAESDCLAAGDLEF